MLIGLILNTIMVKFVETDSRLGVTRSWRGRKDGKLLLNSYRVSVWCVGNISEIVVIVAQHWECN